MSCASILYIPGTRPLSGVRFENISSLFVAPLFILLRRPFIEKKVFNFDEVHCGIFFPFKDLALVVLISVPDVVSTEQFVMQLISVC